MSISSQVGDALSSQTSDVLSGPSEEYKRNTSMWRFMTFVENEHRGLSFMGEYEKLHAWSVREPALFWSLCWRFLDLPGEQGPLPHLVNPNDMVKSHFFPGGYMNFAECALSHGAKDVDEAILFCVEGGFPYRVVSWGELRKMVGSVMQSLSDFGIGRGDRVCGLVANTPETVAVMLGVVGVGAVWSSVSPDFGSAGVLERFKQIKPKLLFASEGYFLKGIFISISETIDKVAAGLMDTNFQGVVLLPFSDRIMTTGLIGKTGFSTFSYFLLKSADSGKQISFAKTSFNDPAFILFSSGTTGPPKCIVHRHGVALQLAKEHALHCEIFPGQKVFYYTTTTWMMWHWLVGGLTRGATILLWEGAVFYPQEISMLEFAKNAHFMGVSAKYVDALKQHGAEVHKCMQKNSNVRTVGSTGSVLSAEGFDWLYNHIGSIPETPFSVNSLSGGTDILSCFMLGCPIKPVRRGRLQCRGLGMDVRVFTDSGELAAPGEKGELVCCTPFPSQPVGFFGDDPEKQNLYRAAYFEKFPGVWHHGDFIEKDADGSLMVFGRSDATLKPGGVRIGTAEIYRAVESIHWVKEAVCVGWDRGEGEVVALFIVKIDQKSLNLSEAEKSEIQKTVLNRCTRHHVPKFVELVADIPRTRNGKITELAVKDVLHGKSIKNANALINPEALEIFKKFRD